MSKYVSHHHDHAEHEAELRRLLARHAEKIHDRWYFTDGGGIEHGHTEEAALKIVDACLYLGSKITDRVSVETWSALVEKIASLERRVQ